MAVIRASSIVISQNPCDPNGTIVSFMRSDTSETITIPVSIPWGSNTAQQNMAVVKAAMSAWLVQANGIAAVNTAANNVTL